MLYSKYTEKEIIAIMQFTGLTRQETIDYLNDFYKRHNKIILEHEKETRLFENLSASFNLN
jgi:hypothetical protein